MRRLLRHRPSLFLPAHAPSHRSSDTCPGSTNLPGAPSCAVACRTSARPCWSAGALAKCSPSLPSCTQPPHVSPCPCSCGEPALLAGNALVLHIDACHRQYTQPLVPEAAAAAAAAARQMRQILHHAAHEDAMVVRPTASASLPASELRLAAHLSMCMCCAQSCAAANLRCSTARLAAAEPDW